MFCPTYPDYTHTQNKGLQKLTVLKTLPAWFCPLVKKSEVKRIFSPPVLVDGENIFTVGLRHQLPVKMYFHHGFQSRTGGENILKTMYEINRPVRVMNQWGKYFKNHI